MTDLDTQTDALALEFQYVITNNEDGTSKIFPVNPHNTDYQTYLAMVTKGNQTPVKELEK